MTGVGLHLGVALDGAGWHPSAWREPSARPTDLFTPGYWVDLAARADRGGADYLTVEDSFTLQSEHPFVADDRTDRVRGRLDAALVAARVAPATTHVGLVPTITTAHTEPFLVGVRVASLDWVSRGRAGWRVQVPRHHDEVALFGRRPGPDPRTLDDAGRAARAASVFAEAADVVEVARRLWDSWEDDAEVRDRPTGRFVDADKLHPIDFVGDHFSVRGPSITPRSPQGQPPVVVLAHVPVAHDLAARSADVVLVTPDDVDVEAAARAIADVRAAEDRVGRTGPGLLVHAEVVVLLEATEAAARSALARLDDAAGGALRSDAAVLATTPDDLADRLAAWAAAGLDGVRVRPARLPRDLDLLVDEVVPALVARGLRPAGPGATTLRGRLGLDRPASRYASEVSP